MIWDVSVARPTASILKTMLHMNAARFLRKEGVILAVIFTSATQAKDIVGMLNAIEDMSQPQPPKLP